MAKVEIKMGEIGGSKLYYSDAEITLVDNTPVTIDVGFEPDYIAIQTDYYVSNNANVPQVLYNKAIKDIVIIYNANGTIAGIKNVGDTNSYLEAITSTGFVYNGYATTYNKKIVKIEAAKFA